MNAKVDLECRAKFWIRDITLEAISIHEITKPMGLIKMDYDIKKREGSLGPSPERLHHLNIRGSEVTKVE